VVWYGTEWDGNGIIGNQREEKGSEADGQIQSTRESKKATTQEINKTGKQQPAYIHAT
jgi:hypothetical protein